MIEDNKMSPSYEELADAISEAEDTDPNPSGMLTVDGYDYMAFMLSFTDMATSDDTQTVAAPSGRSYLAPPASVSLSYH